MTVKINPKSKNFVQKYQLPNVISGFRLIAATGMITYYAIKGFAPEVPLPEINPLLESGALTTIFVTDAVDGYLARKYDAQTITGQWLDPVADKVATFGIPTFMAISQISDFKQLTALTGTLALSIALITAREGVVLYKTMKPKEGTPKRTFGTILKKGLGIEKLTHEEEIEVKEKAPEMLDKVKTTLLMAGIVVAPIAGSLVNPVTVGFVAGGAMCAGTEVYQYFKGVHKDNKKVKQKRRK